MKRTLRYVSYLIVILLALALVGAWFPAIPVLGSLGPMLTAAFGSWIVILSAIGMIAAGMRWRRRNSRFALLIAALSTFTAASTAIIQAQQIRLARANGVEIDLARTLWLGSVEHSSAPPILARYGSDQGRPLHVAIYRPVISPSRSPAPILVYVHGGGWGGGTLHDKQPDMRWYADRGYLVISIEYTLSTEKRASWNLAEPQVACALNWIGANARRYGGDTQRLALLGESAGGNLVVNVAYRMAAGKLQSRCPGAAPRIAAVIAPYPVLDALRMYANNDVIAGPFARQMTTRYTGGTPDRYPDRYTAISSPTHIHRGAPPTLLIPALADHLLPSAVALDFASRAKEAGVPIRVIAFPYGEHSFDQMSGSIGSQLVRGATLQFLSQHGVKPGAVVRRRS